jgi:hypothetical protein
MRVPVGVGRIVTVGPPEALDGFGVLPGGSKASGQLGQVGGARRVARQGRGVLRRIQVAGIKKLTDSSSNHVRRPQVATLEG